MKRERSGFTLAPNLNLNLHTGGQARIRTLEADGNRFTVCPLWPLGYLPETPAHDTTHLAGCRKSPPAAFSLRSEAQRTEAYAFASSLTAALLDGLFEHPARCSPVVLAVRTIEFKPCHNCFSTACYVHHRIRLALRPASPS